VANKAVSAWHESEAGVPAVAEISMNAFFESMSSSAPEAKNVMQQAGPFGALHELLTKEVIASGMPFKMNITLETQPWFELFSYGKFSPEVLRNLAPSSFMIDARWVALLEKSPPSWLRSLHLGVAALEQGNANRSRALFKLSNAMQPTAVATRNLAIIAPTPAEALLLYNESFGRWKALAAAPSGGGTPEGSVWQLGRELASEIASWLGRSKQFAELRGWLDDEEAALANLWKRSSKGGAATDSFLITTMQLKLHEKEHATVLIELSKPSRCFAGVGGDAGAGRVDLLKLFAQATEAAEVEKNGGKPLDALQARRLRRRLGGLDEESGSEKGGRWGPPNLGVWFGSF